MTQTANARADDAGAAKAGELFTAKPNTPRVFPQRAPRACVTRFAPTTRGMLRDLDDAARDGRLTRWEAEFIVSLQRQITRSRWRPSPRQDAVIRRLHAGLAEAEATLIDNHDTVDALRRDRRQAPAICEQSRSRIPAGLVPAIEP